MKRTVFVYRDVEDRWRWHLVAANRSDILADSGQGYTQRNKAAGMARSVFAGSGYLLAWRDGDTLHTEVIQ